MIRRLVVCVTACLFTLTFVFVARGAEESAATTTSPAPSGTSAPPGAVILFDGSNTNAWTTKDGQSATWQILDDVDAMVAGGGDILSKELFEDVQLHVEFWLPKNPPEVTGQKRSNSGVFLQKRYEIQILDSYGQDPKKDGCGSIYNRRKPKENACTPPETWQTYDITYKAPRFDEAGKKTQNARVTVIHNGVTIHQDAEIEGPTRAGETEESPGPAPIVLQDHKNPVRFRNIWAKALKSAEKPGSANAEPTTQPKSVRQPLN